MVQESTRSLICNDRIHELIQELSELRNRHWDSVMVNETWRKTKRRTVDEKKEHAFAAKGNSRACHGTATLIHTSSTKHIKEVQHSAHRSLHRDEEGQTTSLLSLLLPSHGYGDAHVQQVHSKLQKHTDRCRKTNTHILIQLIVANSAKIKTTTKPRTTQPNNASNLTTYS